MTMLPLLMVLAGLPLAAVSAARSADGARGIDKQLVVTIEGPDLRGGVISEIAWDDGTLVLQGVFALPTGELSSQYFVIPAGKTALEKRVAHTDASSRYWIMKSSRVSPTGLGKIESTSDTSMPQFGVGSLERRIGEAYDMGGTQTRNALRLGRLIIFERSGTPPYDGETWSWSPPEVNRIAYVDSKGDLWIARSDGSAARRLLKGDFTLPAWSTDGRSIAVAERKSGGRRWDISVIHLPAEFR